MTELLLDAGADINASTYDGDTPLSLAQNNDQTQVAEFIQIRRQASSVVDIKAESTPVSDTGVIDISGTYIADLSGDPKLIKKLLLGAKPEDKPVFVMVQNGDQIRVTVSGSKGAYGQIYGVIEGNTVRLRWQLAKGKFNLKPGGNELTGTVMHTGSGAGIRGNAELSLRKIESDDAQIPDVSGTYTSEITHKDLPPWQPKDQYFGPQPKIEVKIEQNGNAITGTISGDRSGKIKGVLTGNRITFDFNYLGSIVGQNWGEGVWVVSDDLVILNGTWKTSDKEYNSNGIWNLTKIE
jgi:hypothetical protein